MRVRCLRNLVQVVGRDVAVGIGVLAAGADATLANVIQVAPVVGVLSSGVVRDFHDVACADGASQEADNGASTEQVRGQAAPVRVVARLGCVEVAPWASSQSSPVPAWDVL